MIVPGQNSLISYSSEYIISYCSEFFTILKRRIHEQFKNAHCTKTDTFCPILVELHSQKIQLIKTVLKSWQIDLLTDRVPNLKIRWQMQDLSSQPE